MVDTDASNEELAGIRWYEFGKVAITNLGACIGKEPIRHDGRHAWNASMAMDAQGNIGMGYSSMSGPNSSNTTYIGSYYTGREVQTHLEP